MSDDTVNEPEEVPPVEIHTHDADEEFVGDATPSLEASLRNAGIPTPEEAEADFQQRMRDVEKQLADDKAEREQAHIDTAAQVKQDNDAAQQAIEALRRGEPLTDEPI